MRENQRSQDLPGSATLGLAAKAKALAAAGRPVISMAVGEPDFDAPLAARQAALRAIESGQVRYTPSAGLHTLRAALAQHIQETRGLKAGPNQIVVAHSCKHALSSAVQVLTEPGDEVLLFAPSWNSYEAQVQFAGGVPIWVPPSKNLRPDFERIAAAITPRTKGVLLNSPCNPTGVVWTRAELERLAELCAQHDLWIISDEIYRRLVYTGAEFLSPLQLGPDVAARTVVVDGASKSYAMTGYRIGFAFAPAPIAAAIDRLQSQITGCPNYVSQEVYLAVLETEPPEVSQMQAAFEKRRDVLIPALRDMGLACEMPGGAFYAFPRVTNFLGGRSTEDFCQDLLESESLAVVPGAIFGSPDHIRLSYSLKMDDLREAAARLARFLQAVPS